MKKSELSALEQIKAMGSKFDKNKNQAVNTQKEVPEVFNIFITKDFSTETELDQIVGTRSQITQALQEYVDAVELDDELNLSSFLKEKGIAFTFVSSDLEDEETPIHFTYDIDTNDLQVWEPSKLKRIEALGTKSEKDNNQESKKIEQER